MLGFRPDKSTEENLRHGEELLKKCNHGSIYQLQKWWQDPNMYYAFESKAGARWLARHGGPPKFLAMVEAHMPERKHISIADPFSVQLKCHSCGQPFEETEKKMTVKICRCVCGTKVTHTDCFMPETCPLCNVKMSVVVRKEDLLKIN